MRVRGIHCDKTRQIVERVLDEPGWVYDGITRGSHGCLRWTPTGERVYFGFTPSDPFAWKALAREIEKASGLQLLVRVKRRPREERRTAPAPAPLDLGRIARANARADAAAAARRNADIAATAAAEKRRREIADLMRPGGR